MPRTPRRRTTSALLIALHAAQRVPWPLWRPLAVGVGTLLAVRPPKPLRTWQSNVQTLTGQRPDRRLTRDAVVSWARNFVESVQLGRLSPQQIRDRVVFAPGSQERLQRLAAEPGAVIALPHQGSWDLAGAWACLHGMPVSTVAEELIEPEFAFFVAERERLGFTVYGHRRSLVSSELIRDARNGALVCLLADRNFSRGGVPVLWPTPSGPVPGKLPPGPAHVARQSGSVLLGLACHYERNLMRITVSEPIRWRANADDGSSSTEHEEIADMMQQVCDFFAEQLSAHPADWHMMRPVFAGARPGPSA